ncbi:hypothetical protein QFZ77_007508 [Paenibacillus sp. V4I3]|uniref:hypothetical protein n=1 Tax=Paenibacillus sp. V4I3 TaxID=3042305 RepID=UPI002781B421|nr:hypothetical protein [Paenibacillus sp. V4I3]MDQ0878849.1 hypothetical protein [Paenibacillus sp. V4I3]
MNENQINNRIVVKLMKNDSGGERILNIRKSNITDHEFLVSIDLKNDGYTLSDVIDMTEQNKEEHSKKIEGYLTDSDKGAFVIEDSASGKPIAMIMYSIANRDSVYPWKTIYNELDRNLFQIDLEEEAQKHKVNLIYTHTEETNNHVIELNINIGYQEVRRGPIWDDVIRVSLIKQLR